MRAVHCRIATAVLLASLTLASAGAVAAESADRDAFRDGKVANFNIPGTDYASPAFEQFSFWVASNGRTRIDYGYGSPYKALTVRQVAGAPGAKGFAVRFPNGHVFDITPAGDTLVVTDRDSPYRKTFAWRYEGPVDGVGTFCAPCVEESEATGFVRSHFITRKE